jgi:hypothetical protein
MPLLTRWYIRLSLLYLLAALAAGFLLAAQPVFGLSAALTLGLGPVYFHLFLVGWVTHLIFGVVYWMFPKYSREQPRGSEAIGWATLALLSTGLILRTLAEPAVTRAPAAGWGSLLAVSAVLQWLAGILFVANTWGRVKEK